MVGDETEAVDVDALADVLCYAILIELHEVVEAIWLDGTRIRHIEVESREQVCQILRPVGEAVVVFVSELRGDSLEVEVVRILVRKAVECERRSGDLPWVGRNIAAVILLDEGESASVELLAAVVEVPRVHDITGRKGRRLVVRRAEHDVELPAVRDAIAVVVVVAGLERPVAPLAVEVDPVLERVARAHRRINESESLEVAHDEVLVERGERLRVHGCSFSERDGVRRRRVVSELVVYLRMDKCNRTF